MSSSTSVAPPPPPADPAGAEPAAPDHPGRRRFLTAVLLVVIALILAMWVYAFGFADKRSIYRVSDPAWAKAAEARCAAARTELESLADFRRIADVGPGALQEKAQIVDKANDVLESMLDDIAAGAPPKSQNGADARGWVADYRTYLSNRRDFADQLRAGRNVKFSEAEIGGGGPISGYLTDFAVGNDMRSCAPPTDLSL